MTGKRVTHEDETFGLRESSTHDRNALISVGGFTPQRGNYGGDFTVGKFSTQNLAVHGDTLIDSIHAAVSQLPHSPYRSASRRHLGTARVFHHDAVNQGDPEAAMTAHRYMFNAINSMTHFIKKEPSHPVAAFLPYLHKDLKEYKNMAHAL